MAVAMPAVCMSGLSGKSAIGYSPNLAKPLFATALPPASTALPLSFCTRRVTLHGAYDAGQIMAMASLKEDPSMKKRRVVVTGLGVVTPLGHDPDQFYNNLLEGVSGITEIEGFDCSKFTTKIAGEIKSLSTDGYVAPKQARRIDKFSLYTITAGKKALEDGGMSGDELYLDTTRCGVLIGSAIGGMKVITDGINALNADSSRISPFCIPFSGTNIASAMLAIDLGWMGPNYSISAACATSNFCIVNAARHIISGEADVMLCGGSDAAVVPIGLGGFIACKALSKRNDEPTRASRPWDSGRDGFVLAEGAGVLLLEELEHAKKRGAIVYAEYLGGTFTCDGHHITDPHPHEGTGPIWGSREDVNYINAHATSTKVGDLLEYNALVECFSGNPELRVNSTKSMTGHLLGAAGGIEAVATVQAIRTGWVHPNVNLDQPDGVDTKLLVGATKEQLGIRVAMSNSFGFGGQNSCVLFAPFK